MTRGPSGPEIGWTAMAMVSLLLMVMTGASAARTAQEKARRADGEDACGVGVDHWDCWLSSKLILTS